MDNVPQPWLEEVDPQVLRRRRERIVLILGAVVLFGLFGLLARYLYREPSASTDELLQVAHNAVRARINPNGQLHFSTAAESQVMSVGGERYEVRGWVQDVMESGKGAAYLFTVTLDRDVNRNGYTLVDVSVIEQY